MSVLIKGMEMPTNGCRGCIFVNRKWHGDICPFLKREVTGNVERGGFQTDCPLIPVPPHGRLIDADEITQEIKNEATFAETCIDEDEHSLKVGFLNAYGRSVGIIRSAPTVIESDICNNTCNNSECTCNKDVQELHELEEGET